MTDAASTLRTAAPLRLRPVPEVVLQYRKIHPLAQSPRRGKVHDAGYDIFAVERVVIPPGAVGSVSTGIEISAPPGYYWTLEGRSSLNRKKVFVVRPIIDATYCGEALVWLMNQSTETYVVEPGERPAQLLLHQKLDATFDKVEEFSEEYNQRGRDGYGSTGR